MNSIRVFTLVAVFAPLVAAADISMTEKAWSCNPVVDKTQLRPDRRYNKQPAREAIAQLASMVSLASCQELDANERDALITALVAEYFVFDLYEEMPVSQSWPGDKKVLHEASFDKTISYMKENQSSFFFGERKFSMLIDGELYFDEENRREEEKRYKRELAAKQKILEEEEEEKRKVIARESDLRAGRVKPANIKEAAIFYNAESGSDLASAPKVRPDRKLYALQGKIAMADGNGAPAFLAQLSLGYGGDMLASAIGLSGEYETKYFHVKIPKKLQAYFFDQGKIGRGFDLVGRYVSNTKYYTVTGQEMSAPMFEAVYFVMW